MADQLFSGRTASLVGTALKIVPVTPDDAADLPQGATRALFVGGAGSIAVVDSLGNFATLPSAATQYHPISVRRVLSSGTTATEIFALY